MILWEVFAGDRKVTEYILKVKTDFFDNLCSFIPEWEWPCSLPPLEEAWLVTQVFLIWTRQCSTAIGQYSTGSPLCHRISVNPMLRVSWPNQSHHAHRCQKTLVSGNGMCKLEVLYCILLFCFYFGHETSGSF